MKAEGETDWFDFKFLTYSTIQLTDPEAETGIEILNKSHKMAIMLILASCALLCKTKNLVSKFYPQWLLNLSLCFQVQNSNLWTNLVFACKTETLGFIYSHTLLILNKSSKSKNQMVHEEKFKDLLSNTFQISMERRVIDLESEV